MRLLSAVQMPSYSLPGSNVKRVRRLRATSNVQMSRVPAGTEMLADAWRPSGDRNTSA
jgi:hypothetical protein